MYDNLEFKFFSFDNKEINEQEGTIVHTISGHKVDSDGEVIWLLDATWGIGESKYVPLLYNHARDPIRSDNPLGEIKIKPVEGDARNATLIGESRWAIDPSIKDEFAQQMFMKHAKGFIKGYSIGFKSNASLILDGKKAVDFLKSQGWNDQEAEGAKRVKRGIWIGEVSSVVFPANDKAMDKSAKTDNLEIKSLITSNKSMESEIIELKKRILDMESFLNKAQGYRKEDVLKSIFS